MDIARRLKILNSGKSPSLEAMKATYNKATLSGGVTYDFAANVANIRQLSTTMGSNVLADATMVYVPSSFSENNFFTQEGTGNFNFVRSTISKSMNKLGYITDTCYNLLVNSATGTTQTVALIGGTYDLSFYGTGTYTLTGVATGAKAGTGVNTRVSFPIVATTGNLTLTVSGTITKVQLSLGTQKDYLQTTDRLDVVSLDYSRSLLEPSLLIEPARTALEPFSDTISDANWVATALSKSATTNANCFGVNKGTMLTETSTTNNHYISASVNIVSGTPYTTSWYVKKGTTSWVQFLYATVGYDTSAYANFNFDTGLFGTNGTGASGSAWVATPLNNGYYKITHTLTPTVTATSSGPIISGCNNLSGATRIPSYLGSTSNRICEVAGCQYEAGTNATSFIVNAGIALTRNGCSSNIDLSANTLFNQNTWTLYYEGYLYDGQTTNMSFCLSDSISAATNTNQIGWYNKVTPFYNVSNSRTNSTTGTTNNSFNKLAIQYSAGTANFYLNGVNVYPNRSITAFNYRYLVINDGGSTYTVDKIALWSRTLSSAECIALTT